jgi:uncharacterized protein YecE (DUF72 family)
MEWHIGCSGFHYKEWKDVFYPPKLAQRRWFEFYTGQFHTLELNVTFYRFPRSSFLANWYSASPEGFLFAVKAPRLITHFKKFNACESLLADFYGSVREALKEKLGPVLFQLPPQNTYSEKQLGLILENIDLSFTNVLEFRHSSWWRDDVLQLLSRKQISFCGMSYPGLPDDAIANCDTVYYRFHGVPDLYRSSYSHDQLRKIGRQIARQEGVRTAFIYFNNTASVAAIENARYLEKFVGKLNAGRSAVL